MAEKYILLDLYDEKSKKIAEAFGNKTCKKIIEYLSEIKESSEEDLAKELKIPINTAEYNLKKLISAGLVEKTSNFFWSKKGKKIPIYKLAKKYIVISPKKREIPSKLKSILPAAIISGIGALIIRQIVINKELASRAQDSTALAEGFKVVSESSNAFIQPPSPVWLWFLGGAAVAILIFAVINWRKL